MEGQWLDHCLRNSGALTIERCGECQRSLEGRPFSFFIIERLTAVILQTAIMLLLLTCGLYQDIVSVNTSIAGALGVSLYFGLAIACTTLCERPSQTHASIAQRTLLQRIKLHTTIAVLVAHVTGSYQLSFFSPMVAILHHTWEFILYQGIHTLPRLQPNPQEPMFTTPPMSLSPLFSALARVEPTSKEFLPRLKQFLRSEGECELLVRLEKPAAVYVADVLDKVRDHRAADPRKTWADFCIAFVCASALPPSRIL